MNTNYVALTKMISAFLLTFLSLDLNAQIAVVSPESYWMSNLNSQIKKYVFEFEKSSTLDIALPQGQIVSDQVSLTGRFQMNSVASAADGFNLSFLIDNAEVLAKNVGIHLAIRQDLGFGSATIHLDVQCSAIAIRAKRTQPLQAQLDRNLVVTQLSANLAKEDIETNLIGCTSISGLDQAIQEQALQFVRSQILNEQIHRYLSEEISKQLNTKFSEIGKSLQAYAQTGDTLKMKIDELNRLWVFSGANPEIQFSQTELATLSTATKPTLLIRKSFFEKTLLANLNDSLSKLPILSKANSALNKLTCSRFIQFFTWPSLMSLPKCFDMQIKSQLDQVKLVDISTLNFQFKLNTWAQAPSQLKDIAYFSSVTNISLSSAEADIQSLSGKHFPDFLKWSGKSSRISTSLIQKALEEYISAKIVEFKKKEAGNQIFSLLDLKKAKLISEDVLSIEMN